MGRAQRSPSGSTARRLLCEWFPAAVNLPVERDGSFCRAARSLKSLLGVDVGGLSVGVVGKRRTWGSPAARLGMRLMAGGPKLVPDTRMGRATPIGRLVPKRRRLGRGVRGHDREATSTSGWQAASFVRNRTPPDAPPLRWSSRSSGDPCKFSLMPTSDDATRPKFDALASWRGGTSDRGCNEPNGRGDTVTQGDDLPMAFRAGEQQQVKLP